MQVSPFGIAIIVTAIILLPESLAAFIKWARKAVSEYGKHGASMQSKSVVGG
jgi:hypothetical protein